MSEYPNLGRHRTDDGTSLLVESVDAQNDKIKYLECSMGGTYSWTVTLAGWKDAMVENRFSDE